jgi:hypothetical protein
MPETSGGKTRIDTREKVNNDSVSRFQLLYFYLFQSSGDFFEAYSKRISHRRRGDAVMVVFRLRRRRLRLRLPMPVVAFCLAVAVPALAEIPLSGEQDGLLETNEYLVTGLVTVKRGKTLSFTPGSVVRFKQYGEIVVEGTLKCAGTQHAPIVFTSRNHRSPGSDVNDAPAPFDWNGILAVDSLSSIDIENVYINFSTFGLDIRSLLANIRVKNVVFDGNGKGNIMVAGKQLDVKDKEPFSYSQWLPLDDTVRTAPVAPPPFKEPVVVMPPPKVKTPLKDPWKFPVRLGCGVLAATGTILGFYFDGKVADYQKKFDNEHGDVNAVNSYAENREKASDRRNISKIIAIIGACGFSITFLF